MSNNSVESILPKELPDAELPSERSPRVALFELPEYDQAFGEFLNEAMHGLAATKDPILGQMPHARAGRMYKGRNSVGVKDTVETPVMATRSTFGFNHAVVVGCDVEELICQIDNLADQYAAAVVPQIFAGMAAVTEAFGNSHDAGGAPFSWDMFLDMLEGMEVPFDEQDQPVIPALHTGLGFDPPPMTDEQQATLEVIFERKRLAHLAGRRHRKLPS